MDSYFLVSKIGFVEYRLMVYLLFVFGLNKVFDRIVVMFSIKLIGNEVGFDVRYLCFSFSFMGNYFCSSCFMLDFLYLVGEFNWEKCKLFV